MYPLQKGLAQQSSDVHMCSFGSLDFIDFIKLLAITASLSYYVVVMFLLRRRQMAIYIRWLLPFVS